MRPNIRFLATAALIAVALAVAVSAEAGCGPDLGCPAGYGSACAPSLEDLQREARAKKFPGASIGMTADEVTNATGWGPPCSVNRTVTAKGEREQWVYPSNQFLYFENGKLVAIETSGH